VPSTPPGHLRIGTNGSTASTSNPETEALPARRRRVSSPLFGSCFATRRRGALCRIPRTHPHTYLRFCGGQRPSGCPCRSTLTSSFRPRNRGRSKPSPSSTCDHRLFPAQPHDGTVLPLSSSAWGPLPRTVILLFPTWPTPLRSPAGLAPRCCSACVRRTSGDFSPMSSPNSMLGCGLGLPRRQTPRSSGASAAEVLPPTTGVFRRSRCRIISP